MATLINDPRLEERLRADRAARGADRYDEVWEGVYIMAPIPNDEHQQIVGRLDGILQDAVGWPGLGEVRPGVNLSDRQEDWEHNYRVPDVAVFLRNGKAENCDTHWRGAADLLIEVASLRDRTHEKIPFYSRLGVVELLIVERDPWQLELYHQREDGLVRVGRSTPEGGEVLASTTVPLTFQLVPGDPRPHVKVTHPESGRVWLV